MLVNDPHYKKTLSFNYQGQKLRFDVSPDVFSSFAVDVGTQLLLRTLVQKDYRFSKVLDLGCGYGPLGLALRKVYPSSKVHLVDKDALSVMFAQRNILLNRLTDTKAYISLGYDDIQDTDYDLIISNIPAKAGEKVITHFLTDAANFLSPQGVAAVVVIKAIADFVSDVLANNSNIKVLVKKETPRYSVFHYSFFKHKKGLLDRAFNRGVYNDRPAQYFFNHINLQIQTVVGLPAITFADEFLLKELTHYSLGTRESEVLVFNPKNGLVPVCLAKLSTTNSIVLVDRDLLSLRVSERNLILTGFDQGKIVTKCQTTITADNGKYKFITGVLREAEGRAAVLAVGDQIADGLLPGGLTVLAGSSTGITRLENLFRSKGLTINQRDRLRGISRLIAHKR